MRIFLLLPVALCFLFTNAQDKTVVKLKTESTVTIKKDASDTTVRIWKKGGIYSLNLSQGSLSNWAAGGDNFSLALNSLLSAYAFYKKGKYSWNNTLDFQLGYFKTTSLGSRKNDDRLDILSKYGYAVAPKWNVAGLFNFRSQLFKGYTYPNGMQELSSAFLSPAYVLLGAGMDFKPSPFFSLFISPATIRWVIVENDSIAAKGLYGVPKGQHSVSEFGAFLTANFLKDLSKNLNYKGRLDLFSNYKHNPQNIDVFFSNIFTAKISKIISASWNLDLIYDDDVKLFGPNGDQAAWQIKSLIGFGLLVKF